MSPRCHDRAVAAVERFGPGEYGATVRDAGHPGANAGWVADQATQALRRQVSRRAHIVRQRTRLKNQVQAILHRNLIPRCPAADLFGLKGRCWLANQPLPADEELAVDALMRQLDFHGQELRIIDAALGRVALGSPEVKRLMTIPGVDATVALAIVAAIGDCFLFCIILFVFWFEFVC